MVLDSAFCKIQIYKMYLLRCSLSSGIEGQCVSISEQVRVRGGGLRGGGNYQTGINMPLKALFLVIKVLRKAETVGEK